MKKTIISIIAAFFILLPLHAFSLDSLHELRHTNTNYDLFVHVDMSLIQLYFSKNGISKDDLPYLFGDKAVTELDTAKKKADINISDFESLSFAAQTSQIEKNKDFILIVQFKNNKPIKELEKSTKTIAGFPAMQINDKEDVYLVQKENLLIAGKFQNLEVLLERSAHNRNANDVAQDFADTARGKSVLYRIIDSEQLKKALLDMAGKNKKNTDAIKRNPYINALLNFKQHEAGITLGDKRSAYMSFSSNRPEDAERLLMLSHFNIVLTSFMLTYFELGPSALALLNKTPERKPQTQEDTTASQSAIIAQEILAKLKTEKTHTGAVIALDIDDRDNSLIIDKVKDAIKKNKAETTKRLQKEALLAAISDAHEGQISKISEYLSKGYDINARNDTDETLLTTACEADKSVVVSFLLGKKADPNKINGLGKSPLIIAASKGNLAIVKMLVEAGADASFRDRDDKSAYDRAQEGGFIDVAEYLRKIEKAK